MVHVSSGRDGGFNSLVSAGLLGPPPAPAFEFPRRHEGVNCDGCGAAPITGVRYKCSQCPNFDLCETCLVRLESGEGRHGPASEDEQHLFLRVPRAKTTAARRLDLCDRSMSTHEVRCSGCGAERIVGFRYSCQVCVNVHLCEACEALGSKHDPSHPRLKAAAVAAPRPSPVPAPSVASFDPFALGSGGPGIWGGSQRSGPAVSAATVEAMLRREEALRLCDETQAALRAVRAQPNRVFEVIEELQRRVAREFGVPEVQGLRALRCAEDWIGEERAKELSFYRRHRERCADGPLRVGDTAPLAAVPPLPRVRAGLGGAALQLASLGAARPLVLVAGSHSWPPLRGAVAALNGMAARFGAAADFVFVYISEAHASDEWPISQLDEEIPRHRSLGDRRAAAEGLLRALPLHRAFEVALDTMEDAFDAAFRSWPFRFWVVQAGRLALKPQPRNATYDVGELERWLTQHCGAGASAA